MPPGPRSDPGSDRVQSPGPAIHARLPRCAAAVLFVSDAVAAGWLGGQCWHHSGAVPPSHPWANLKWVITCVPSRWW